MEKKEYTPKINVACAIISILSFTCCGLLCFTLNQALKTERHDVGETRAQTIALHQALKIQEHDLSETREQLAAATGKIADAQKQNQALSQQLTEIQSKLLEGKAVAQTHFVPMQMAVAPAAAAPDIAAADSVEGQLRSGGKHWERTEGQPLGGDTCKTSWQEG
jgi:septal ring factor EnvC (AmiA/AmiB activator)